MELGFSGGSCVPPLPALGKKGSPGCGKERHPITLVPREPAVSGRQVRAGRRLWGGSSKWYRFARRLASSPGPPLSSPSWPSAGIPIQEAGLLIGLYLPFSLEPGWRNGRTDGQGRKQQIHTPWLPCPALPCLPPQAGTPALLLTGAGTPTAPPPQTPAAWWGSAWSAPSLTPVLVRRGL